MNSASEYPRVLVVDANPFCWHMNIGIVKSNLFLGWPKDSLAQIMYSNTQPAFDVCARYWVLSKTSIIRDLVSASHDHSLNGSTLKITDTAYNPALAHNFESRSFAEQMLSGLATSIKVPVGEAILRLPSVISASLAKWIEEFRPQVVLTNSGNGAILRLAVKIAERWNLCLVPCFNDDWIPTSYQNALFGSALRASSMRWFLRSLALSKARLAMSDGMRAEYQQRFGMPFQAFMNSVDRVETTPEPTYPVTRFTYIGALAPNRWQPLFNIGAALSKLRSEGVMGELVIHSFPDDIRQFGHIFEKCQAIRIERTLPAQEVRAEHQAANVLVHAESFDKVSRAATRLSLSTKIPQYLMAGRCVLAYGPSELASIDYVRQTGAGLAISTEEIDEVASGIKNLITSSEVRQRYADAARRTGLSRHEAVSERERFRACLSDAVVQHGEGKTDTSVAGLGHLK